MNEDNSRDELIAVLQRIIDGEYETEEDLDGMIEFLRSKIPNADVIDQIFGRSRPDDTAETMLDRMFEGKPIILRDHSNKRP